MHVEVEHTQRVNLLDASFLVLQTYFHDETRHRGGHASQQLRAYANKELLRADFDEPQGLGAVNHHIDRVP